MVWIASLEFWVQSDKISKVRGKNLGEDNFFKNFLLDGKINFSMAEKCSEKFLDQQKT